MNDNPLLPPPDRDSARYAARPETQRDWSFQEDLSLFPPILACDSEREYLACVRTLCELLNRQPVYPETARPTAKTRSDDCQALIERRTVTSVLSRREGVVPVVTRIYHGARTGFPLTWAERVKVLQPFARKGMKGTQRLKTAELMMLLEREQRDWPTVHDYLELFRKDKISEERERFPAPETYAHHPSNQRQLVKRLIRFIGSPEEGMELQTAWSSLCELCEPTETK